MEPQKHTQQRKFILASASPRRRELLMQLGKAEGTDFDIYIANIDEIPQSSESAEQYVQRIANEKAMAVSEQLANQENEHKGYDKDTVILAADTAVTINGHILGKPVDTEDALKMYKTLSGQIHQVYTALCVLGGQESWSAMSRSEVSFVEISTAQALAYWKTGEGKDKAGGYAIQGLAAMFIEHMTGSYSGVMGLPLYETAKLLNQAGITVLSTDHE